MQLDTARGSRLVGACILLAIAFSAPIAWAVQGEGSLFVSGGSGTPTHWDIPIGVPTNAEIHGVDPAEVGGTLPPTLDIIIKSSVFGNTVVTGTQIGMSGDYAFTYTPPALANGDEFDACSTTIVAYFEPGLNSNNDYRDDGLKNDSADSASGFRFIDANGDPLPCTVGVQPMPWSGVKSLYH